MKRILVFLFLFGLLRTWADTLDYARYVIVVTAFDGSSVDMTASRNLAEQAMTVLKGTSYDRDMTVADFLALNPKQAKRLERMTLESRRTDAKFRSDGAVSVDYEFPISGAVLEQLLPVTGGGRLLGRIACPCCGQEWPDGKEVPSDVEPVPYESGQEHSYTGVLVDGRGYGLRPALFPEVVAEVDGPNREVIGPGFADERFLAQRGMVGYYKDRAEAMLAERVGANPLVVRAVGLAGAGSCDLVVSAYDAVRLHGSKANLRLLAECRVGFLVD